MLASAPLAFSFVTFVRVYVSTVCGVSVFFDCFLDAENQKVAHDNDNATASDASGEVEHERVRPPLEEMVEEDEMGDAADAGEEEEEEEAMED